MITIEPFEWRKLTPLSTLEHRLDSNGNLLLREPDSKAVPFKTARVRDGAGGFIEKPLQALGFEWSRADDGDGWALRTTGDPITMSHAVARWTWLVAEESAELLVDERFLLTTIACEVGDVAPNEDGLRRHRLVLRLRHGLRLEADRGDGERDAEDWAAFEAKGKRGVTHSSHGLMQTLISTAVSARPDLFFGLDPANYRDVLADPARSIACGTAYAATFPREVRHDPLASRFQYGAGSVRPTSQNRWGAVLYDELVPLMFVAFWNDLAFLRADDWVVPVPSSKRAPAPSSTAEWLFASFSCLLLALAASFATAAFARRAT